MTRRELYDRIKTKVLTLNNNLWTVASYCDDVVYDEPDDGTLPDPYGEDLSNLEICYERHFSVSFENFSKNILQETVQFYPDETRCYHLNVLGIFDNEILPDHEYFSIDCQDYYMEASDQEIEFWENFTDRTEEAIQIYENIEAYKAI